MRMVNRIFATLRPAVDLIYPPRCPLCGEAIADQKGLCVECWSGLIIPGSPCCATCQRPFPSESVLDENAQCASCMAVPPIHAGIAAATLYNEPARKLVLSYKHGKRIALAQLLGRLMEARLPVLEGEWLIVPVPLHWTRLWARGFNQSALLARYLAKATGHRLVVDGLSRHKRTDTLGGLGRKERESMLRGAISINTRRAAWFKDANIILVDDVLTSGATSNAATAALKKAGAQKVVVSCFSRVLGDLP